MEPPISLYRVTTDKKSWDYIRVLTWHDGFELVRTDEQNFVGYFIKIPDEMKDKLIELRTVYPWIMDIEEMKT